MSSLNKVLLIGNLGSDPETRFTPSGAQVANFSLATSESWNDKNGQRQERTEWHRIVLWQRLAEIAGQYLKKGSKIYIEGKLQTRSWEDQQGHKRQATEIVANTMKMLGAERAAEAAESTESNGHALAGAPVAGPDHGDLPF